MQYTGLKDKNSNEIYEGDIIRVIYNYKKRLKVSVLEVKFYNGCFMVDINDGWDLWSELWHYTKHWSVEVIGNVYENPELLDGDNND